MINDLNVQHELLKTALSATDNYLAVESKAKAAGTANAVMLKDFIASYNIAYKALESLGVLDQHEEYMQGHLNTMWSMANEEDATLADDPYSSSTGSSGSTDESFGFTISAFKAFISEDKEQVNISEEEIDEMVEALTWDDIVDLYDKEDLIDEEVNYLEEGLTAQSRLKKRQAFARFKGKRGTAKGIKLRRASTPQVLQKRALLAARRSLYNRFLRGRDKSTLSASEKSRIEQQVKKLKNIQSSIAMRMVPKMRSIEQKRLSHYRGNTK